ncbi:hypothetical protein Sjap_002933 [Stephania japonica]|uniref:RNase H type-1 domain-containing protein n=1 Tax=Stephania japonica TaxID=461633 RepID=A0AAP0PT09_9MAGN
MNESLMEEDLMRLTGKLLLCTCTSFSPSIYQVWSVVIFVKSQIPLSLQKWIPIEFGCLKLNVDASVTPYSSRVGLGGIIRNHEGSFYGDFTMCMEGTFSPEVVELLAIREGLNAVAQAHLQIDIVKKDAATKVMCLKNSQFNCFVGLIV